MVRVWGAWSGGGRAVTFSAAAAAARQMSSARCAVRVPSKWRVATTLSLDIESDIPVCSVVCGCVCQPFGIQPLIDACAHVHLRPCPSDSSKDPSHSSECNTPPQTRVAKFSTPNQTFYPDPRGAPSGRVSERLGGIRFFSKTNQTGNPPPSQKNPLYRRMPFCADSTSSITTSQPHQASQAPGKPSTSAGCCAAV